MVGSAGIVSVLICVSQVSAQTLTGAELAKALQQGGYVIVMRHATSPQAAPDKEHANADNLKLERQLDAAGRDSATAMGQALRGLNIPIGAVLTSPTYRALETVKYAGLRNPQTVEQLGDGGQSMAAVADAAAAWLRERTNQRPAAGTNTVIITHLPNITRAFPDWQPQVADGESVILRPAGGGRAQVVSRVRIEEWPEMRQRAR